MKKIFALILALMMVLSLAACGAKAPAEEAPAPEADAPAVEDTNGDGEIVIAYALYDYSYEFFQTMLGSSRKTAEELGVKLLEVDGGSDVYKQIESLNDLLANYDLDAIFLNPVDADAIGAFTVEANAAGVPVVTVDIRSNEGEVFAHVASSNYDIGVLAGEHAVELLKARNGAEKGVCYVMGLNSVTSQADRVAGFKDYLADFADIEVKEIVVTEGTVLESQSKWDDTLIGNVEGTIDVVYGANAQTATGIIAACESANRTEIDVIGTDDDAAIMEALGKNGFVAATVVQSPIDMGKLGVEMCVKAANGETIESKEVPTELKLVTREDFAEYNESMKAAQEAIAAYKD